MSEQTLNEQMQKYISLSLAMIAIEPTASKEIEEYINTRINMSNIREASIKVNAALAEALADKTAIEVDMARSNLDLPSGNEIQILKYAKLFGKIKSLDRKFSDAIWIASQRWTQLVHKIYNS